MKHPRSSLSPSILAWRGPLRADPRPRRLPAHDRGRSQRRGDERMQPDAEQDDVLAREVSGDRHHPARHPRHARRRQLGAAARARWSSSTRSTPAPAMTAPPASSTDRARQVRPADRRDRRCRRSEQRDRHGGLHGARLGDARHAHRNARAGSRTTCSISAPISPPPPSRPASTEARRRPFAPSKWSCASPRHRSPGSNTKSTR